MTEAKDTPEPKPETPSPAASPATSPPDSAVRRTRRGRRTPWWLWVLLALVLLVSGGVVLFRRFTSDTFVRAQALTAAEEYLAGRIEVGRASARMLRDLRVWNFRQYGDPAQPSQASFGTRDEPMLAVAQIECEVNPWAFLYGEVEPTRLVLRDIVLRMARGKDGRYNVERMCRPIPEKVLLKGRFFRDGIALRRMQFRMRDRAIFGDNAERVIEETDLDMRFTSTQLKSFEYTGRIRRGPLRGASVFGWLDCRDENAPVELSLETRLPRMEIEAGVMDLLPASVRRMCTEACLSGSIEGAGGLSLDHHRRFSYWADLECADVAFRIQNPQKPNLALLTVRDLSAQLRIDKQRVQCRSIVGRLHGGLIQGTAILHFDLARPEPSHSFRVSLRAENIPLAQVVKAIEGDSGTIKGRMSFFADLSGAISSRGNAEAHLHTLKGHARVRLTDAYLGELPTIARFYKAVNLQAPTRTVLDAAEAELRFDSGVAYFDRLHISSRNIEITGAGKITFKGDCDLVLTVLARKAPDELPVIPDAVRYLTSNLMPPVHMTGKVWAPKYSSMPKETFKNIIRKFPLLGTWLVGPK